MYNDLSFYDEDSDNEYFCPFCGWRSTSMNKPKFYESNDGCAIICPSCSNIIAI